MKTKGVGLLKVIEAFDLIKIYQVNPKVQVSALRGCDLSIEQGKHSVIMGRSGSGKSTLLNILSLNADKTTGKLFYKEKSVDEFDLKSINSIKKIKIGVYSQNIIDNVFPSLSIKDNFRLALMNNSQIQFVEEAITSMAKKLGLIDRLNSQVYKLSGGEIARVGFGNFILRDDIEIYFFDELTSNLDLENVHRLLEILTSKCKNEGKTVVSVTHDANYVEYTDCLFILSDGRLSSAIQDKTTMTQTLFSEYNSQMTTQQYSRHVDSFGFSQIPTSILKHLKIDTNINYEIVEDKVLLSKPKEEENERELSLKNIQNNNSANRQDTFEVENEGKKQYNIPSKLTLTQLSIEYNNKAIVSNFNMQLTGGKISVLMGRSGSGKSSILKCIVGDVIKSSGNIHINGICVDRPVDHLQLFQNNALRYMPQLLDIVPDEIMLKIIDMWKLLSNSVVTSPYLFNLLNLPPLVTTSPLQLSGGQLQRFVLGLFLSNPPSILLLDEPTSHQDDNNTQIILSILQDFVQSSNSIVLIASHDQRLLQDGVDKIEIESKFTPQHAQEPIDQETDQI
ncbi:MAG: Lipoprotein-releasing system ATP-binding protein LolD [Candidatus Heimdallarchaeota archaeon LC_2]|nr:MAG: Lipoprotein-releasing system ATP-binding protein LolD [Candidatus Heimdallarchaeota archaeon LC_2]